MRRPRAGSGPVRRLGDLPQPVRFLLAGGLAALVNWLARFPLSWFLPYGLAVVGFTYTVP